MTQREKRLIMEFPAKLDIAIAERFGIETKPKTTYSFFEDRHITEFEAEGFLRERILDFIDGYIKGNVHLRDRLLQEA